MRQLGLGKVRWSDQGVLSEDFAAVAGATDWVARHPMCEPAMDQQHQTIFQQIQLFTDTRTVAERYFHIDQLVGSVCEHFQCEEALMQRLGFNDYEEHARSHTLLLERLHRLRQRLSGDLLDTMEMGVFFKHWARSHLPLADARFAEFLAFEGRKSTFL